MVHVAPSGPVVPDASGTVGGQGLYYAAQGSVLGRLYKDAVDNNDGYGGGIARFESTALGVLYEGAWGKSQYGPLGVPVTPDMAFEVASVTKAVTATAIMLLFMRGFLRLDARLDALAPALLEAIGAPPHFGNVTISQLLHHTSGLPDYWDDDSFLEAFNEDTDQRWEGLDVLRYSARMAPLKQGEFKYSDTNYVLLGLIIEQLTQGPLHDFFRSAIFTPLGMHDTYMSFREAGPPGQEVVRRLTHRYEEELDLTHVPRQSADWAGGGLISTAQDLSRFIRGLAEGGIFGDDTQAVLQIMLGHPVPTGDEGVSYGTGLYVMDLGEAQGRVWGHDGWTNSYVFYAERAKVAMAGTLNQKYYDADWYEPTETAMTVLLQQANRKRRALLGGGGGDRRASFTAKTKAWLKGLLRK